MLIHILVGITLLFQNDIAAADSQECGTITAESPALILNGVQPQKGAVPWHVVIYRGQRNFCAGSLVTADKIISVAHCFISSDKRQYPSEEFAAAVGKLHADWEDKRDDIAQKSDVKEIHIPTLFVGVAANLQDDIALLVVARPFTLNQYVRPVCLSFDRSLNKLQSGNKGKVAGWTVGSADGSPAQSLSVGEMPYVDVATCVQRVAPEARDFITSDKLCAGEGKPGSALCRGDSGVGLAFSSMDRGVVRYYLRGVASAIYSTLTTSDCDTTAYGLFTDVTKHEHFLKRYL